jgi:5-methylcytosine-specific restriction endonuclease McrA
MVRDQHRCQTPGCGGIPREAHHIVFWIHGGITALDNLVALCGHCHRLIHSANSVWTITPVKGGRPVFTRTGPAP